MSGASDVVANPTGAANGRRKYDALVVGSGIGGMESALKLGDMGYKVLVVEKEPSVGGKMILLSKVFPTLDCASCISTPKMGATVHHPNIDVMTYAEVEAIRGTGDGNGNGPVRYHATIKQKPKFVDEAACTGCRQCEMACNVAVPDEYNADMVSRRAAYIAYPQSVPKKAVIERDGVSPCTFACPAGIKAHGYVARVRSGEYEQAFDLVLETTPLVGSLGRACYAPCEGECTRSELEGTLPIRRLKRFLADRRYDLVKAGEAKRPERPEQNGHKVAVVGSGPAGLTAAWQLARKGYGVKIFEAASQPGGMLRLALPSYRLPKDVVDDDVRNVTDLGVEIETGRRVDDVAALRDAGFDAVLVATGTHKSLPLGVPGEELDGVLDALGFLADVNLGRPMDLTGKKVLVVGGGDVAIDTSRTALRLGADEVRIVYRRSREEVPAQRGELECAEAEGVVFDYLTLPVRLFGGDDGALNEVECVRTELGAPDESGRRRPVKVSGSESRRPVDVVICATGMAPDTAAFDLQTNDDGTLRADAGSLQTAVPHVFAAGDVVDGPTTMTRAVGEGRRAAFMIDRHLRGEALDPDAFEEALPAADKQTVLARQLVYDRRAPLAAHEEVAAHPADFGEIEGPMSEEEAFLGAARCLDCGVCSECNACVDACPADCIDFGMREEEIEVDVDAVVLATGFRLFPADAKPEYGYGRFKNVITGMQMDRLLAPTRPFNGVVRPGDGKVPDSIGYILCTGSRDAQVGNPLCSRICCMYSIKHNQLIMGALPLADVSVHYMDVRAVGKGYDEFYTQAKDMGAQFIKGRVGKITEKENGNLVVRYEDVEGDGGIVETEYDMVVLAVGVQPNTEAAKLFEDGALGLDEYFYVGEADDDMDPGRTNMPGVFVAGSASGVKDIPDSILHAGAAVAQAAAHIEKARAEAGEAGAKVAGPAKVEVAR